MGELKARARLWVTEVIRSGRAEAAALLGKADSLRREVARAEDRFAEAAARTAALQEARRALLGRLGECVPRAELDAARAEAAASAAAAEGLAAQVPPPFPPLFAAAQGPLVVLAAWMSRACRVR